MIGYTVKPDQVAHNEELLRAVFAELGQVQPSGLRYAACKLDDGVSFIHFVWMNAEAGHSSLPRLEALRAFHKYIRQRCDEAPVRTQLLEIGSFGLFGE